MTKPIYSEKQKHDAFEWLREYAIEYNSVKAACLLNEIISLNKTVSELKALAENNGQSNAI